jgi:hypothetical protein
VYPATAATLAAQRGFDPRRSGAGREFAVAFGHLGPAHSQDLDAPARAGALSIRCHTAMDLLGVLRTG